jgi:hypothetical protein
VGATRGSAGGGDRHAAAVAGGADAAVVVVASALLLRVTTRAAARAARRSILVVLLWFCDGKGLARADEGERDQTEGVVDRVFARGGTAFGVERGEARSRA